MLSITQFEVYALDHGRWTLHARYGSDQRKAAVMDARNTEFTTGLPTKVVVETYFPEIDESELVTAYISPKARERREAAKNIKRSGHHPMAARRAAVITPSTKPRRLGMRRGVNVRQYIMQGIVAGAFSLVGATLSTVFLSWGLRRSIHAGLPVSSTLSSTILTYGYAVFFLFFFMSLFRSKLPLHRMLSYLWAPAGEMAPKPQETIKSIAAAIAPKLRPKLPPAVVEAEAARAREELKKLRGDPLPEPEPEIIIAAPPPPPAVEVAAPVVEAPPPETATERKKREKKERKEAEERAKAAKVAALAQALEEATAPAPTPPDPMPLERAVLRSFIADVLKPATAGTMPDDPVTRRGVSLVIAGAAATLAETARTSYEGRINLVEGALMQFGVSGASVATFIQHHDELVAAPANASLVNLGRSALAKHLDGTDVTRILAVAIAGWRTPFGQPSGLAPEGDPPAAPTPPATASVDIYILTELRMGAAFAMAPGGAPDHPAEAVRDAAMGLHNSVVRSVLGTHGGHEVKHTGTGIFAQFTDAVAAVAAATEIQRRFTASYGPTLAVALIANVAGGDPLLTPDVIRQAQTAAARAGDGEILAERRVRRAAGTAEDPPQLDAEDDGAALVKISMERESDEPALYEHVPMGEMTAVPLAPPLAAAVAQSVNAP